MAAQAGCDVEATVALRGALRPLPFREAQAGARGAQAMPARARRRGRRVALQQMAPTKAQPNALGHKPCTCHACAQPALRYARARPGQTKARDRLPGVPWDESTRHEYLVTTPFQLPCAPKRSTARQAWSSTHARPCAQLKVVGVRTRHVLRDHERDGQAGSVLLAAGRRARSEAYRHWIAECRASRLHSLLKSSHV